MTKNKKENGMKKKNGYALVEITVVVIVVAILAAYAVPKMGNILLKAERAAAELEADAIKMKFYQIFLKKKSEPTVAQLLGEENGYSNIPATSANSLLENNWNLPDYMPIPGVQDKHSCDQSVANTVHLFVVSYFKSIQPDYPDVLTNPRAMIFRDVPQPSTGWWHSPSGDMLDDCTIVMDIERPGDEEWKLMNDIYMTGDKIPDGHMIQFKISAPSEDTDTPEGSYAPFVKMRASDNSGICVSPGWKYPTFKDVEGTQPTTSENDVVKGLSYVVEDLVNCPKSK